MVILTIYEIIIAIWTFVTGASFIDLLNCPKYKKSNRLKRFILNLAGFFTTFILLSIYQNIYLI